MPPISPYRLRAVEKFKTSAELLQKVLPTGNCAQLSRVPFPEFGKYDDVETNVSELQKTLEEIIQARSGPKRDEGKTQNIRGLVLGWFRASYPFASLFLSIAKEGSSVSSLDFVVECS